MKNFGTALKLLIKKIGTFFMKNLGTALMLRMKNIGAALMLPS